MLFRCHLLACSHLEEQAAILFFRSPSKGRPFWERKEILDPAQIPQRLRASKSKRNRTDESGEAEQFVLRATFDGWYPCYSCEDSQEIYLSRGEIWKYGHTRPGRYNRYAGRWLLRMHLDYRIQQMGTYAQCRRACSEKIAQYANLPENLRRAHQLMLPPANPVNP